VSNYANRPANKRERRYLCGGDFYCTLTSLRFMKCMQSTRYTRLSCGKYQWMSTKPIYWNAHVRIKDLPVAFPTNPSIYHTARRRHPRIKPTPTAVNWRRAPRCASCETPAAEIESISRTTPSFQYIKLVLPKPMNKAGKKTTFLTYDMK